MVKLVYTYALGAYAERRGGSSPLSGTFLLHSFMWLLLFLSLVKPVFAQDTPDLYIQYRTDYLYQRDLYQKDYLDYLNKKDTYAQYGSLTAEKDKITSTKNVFLSQNLMLKNYLMALRVTLPNSPSHQEKLQQWESWLSTQNQLIPNLNSTTSIRTWASTFHTQYIAIQQQLYSSLIQSQIDRRLNTLDEIKKLAQTAGVEWDYNFSDKENKVKQSFQDAIDTTQQNQRQDQFSDFYPEAKEFLDLADIYLRSLISDLKSTIIKNNQ